MRGDPPALQTVYERISLSTPHARGSTPILTYALFPPWVYPACAGIHRLEAQPEIVRRQLLEGDWSVFAGQYFKEWRPDIHVVEPFEIPRWWRRFRSLDYGLDCTACYWWAVDQSGRCYIYR